MRLFCYAPVWVGILLVCDLPAVFAQQDTLMLKELEVFATRLSKSAAGIHICDYTLDSSPGSALQSIDHFLALQTNIPLRGYGPGASFAPSIGGGSAAQTQILINGIPFDNPSLAQADLSLIPTFLFSDIALLRGASGSLLGSASVAGTLMLDQQIIASAPRVTANLSAGSFGDYGASLSTHYGKGIFLGNTSVYWREAQNNFVRTLPNGITEPQPHAHFATKGIQQGMALTARSGLTANATLWLARADRQIPPTLSQLQNTSTQLDETLRLQASVSKDFGGVVLRTDAAFDKGILDYSDPTADIFDTSKFTTSHVQSKLSAKLKGFEFSAIGIYRHNSAWSDNYEGIARRNSPAWVISASRTFFNDQTLFSATLRGEWLNGRFLPLVPTFGLTQNLGKLFQLKANAGRVYRIPGLNDLYWNPGGNPDLLPESGWSQEAGIHFREESSKIHISVSAFNRNVNNWIIWIPGTSYWSPHNLRTVWSSGLEMQASAISGLGNCQLAHRLEYTFVRSTTTRSAKPNDRSLHKQLVYAPEHSVLLEERLEWKKYSITAISQFQSTRYTSADNSESLNPFLVFHIIAEMKWLWQSHKGSLSFTARNLLNQEYELMMNRPLPGRHYLVALQLNLYKPKKTKL